MSGSVNKVILIGRLGKDPEVRTLNSGDKVVNLRLATSETWKDKQSGERKEKTEWHQIVIFNEGLVKVAEEYLEKGSHIYIEGKLQTRKWQGQDGVDKYSTEIVLQKFQGVLTMLGKKSDGGGSSQREEPRSDSYGGGDQGGGFRQDARGNMERESSYDLDDEIPF